MGKGNEFEGKVKKVTDTEVRDREIPFVHHIEERTLEEIKAYFKPDVFIEYCRACEHFCRIWTCPPYDFDVNIILENYKYTYIIGSRLYVRDMVKDNQDLLDKGELAGITNEIYMSARRALDRKLEALEDMGEDLCILLAGRCLLCSRCTREKGLPCIHRDRARYSLESLGFNVADMCQEVLGEKILWAKESLPEYLTLVSAVFSRERLDKTSLKMNLK